MKVHLRGREKLCKARGQKRKMQHTSEQETVRGGVGEWKNLRERVCEVCGATDLCAAAGNQAGTDLASWGCGGSDLISNEYNKREKKLCLTLSGSQAQRAQSQTLRTKQSCVN